MAKTKFKVDIHKDGSENNQLLTVIGNHNSGKVPVSLVDIQSYMTVRRGLMPYSNGCYFATRPEGSNSTLLISEDEGKTWTLTIEEIELEELEEDHIEKMERLYNS